MGPTYQLSHAGMWDHHMDTWSIFFSTVLPLTEVQNWSSIDQEKNDRLVLLSMVQKKMYIPLACKYATMQAGGSLCITHYQATV